MDQQMNILERIHGAYYSLTGAERKVADFVLSQHKQVQFMSITQLAEECGTAEATVSRFCRSLGLKGFNAFKIELAQHSVSVIPPDQEHAADTPAGRAAESARAAMEAIRQTLELTDHENILRAVRLLEAAPRVLCMGAGGSMLLASECAHMFSTVTGKFQTLPDSHMQMSAVATMAADSVIVLFSYSGATTGGLQALELAKERGIATILVTRFSKSPAAKLADVVLCCGSNEGPFQFGSVPARVAQLMVVDILFQEYCHRNREACEENIRRIAAALAGKHV